MSILEQVVEIELFDEGNFLQIKETLSRIGVSSESEGKKKLFPSVLVLHKRGKYFLVPFKVMFILDGKTANISEQDWARYFTIVNLLKEWGLIKIANPEIMQGKSFNIKMVKIVPYQEKDDWEIIHKYRIGSKSNRN